MPLHLQAPTQPAATTLHEEILTAASRSDYGAAVFSYATRDGITLLLGDEAIAPLLASGQFELIVGVDDVTDTRAIEALEAIRREIPGLSVRAFFHQIPDATFHPKFCWFGGRRSGTLIVGSGNLTGRGLRRNWEAFTTTRLDIAALRQLRLQWERWKASHAQLLLPIDDPRVVDQARRNAIRPHRARPPADQVQPPVPLPAYSVLVAEIPRAKTRWNQANFDLATFRGFFGAEPGQLHRIVLQHVNPDGSLAEIENRPAVSVASHNYRFELAPGRGLPYPDAGRPIGVFVRVGPRTFTYRLAMPNDPDYLCITQFLAERWNGPASRLRRISTDVVTLREACPDSPMWPPIVSPEE